MGRKPSNFRMDMPEIAGQNENENGKYRNYRDTAVWVLSSRDPRITLEEGLS